MGSYEELSVFNTTHTLLTSRWIEIDQSENPSNQCPKQFRGGTMHLRKGLLILILLSVAGIVGLSVRSDAVPAFARDLNVKCQTCHFPNPPRLNNVGQLFRRMGFRLPDSDDNGNLVFKTPALSSAMAFGSIIANVDLEVDKNAPSPTESKTNLSIGEVALFSAHALPDHLSYWVVFLPRNDEGDPELDFAEMQYNFGTATDAFHVRGGKFLTLWWQKVNDEGLTLSAPLALDEAAPGPIGSFAGFGLAGLQNGGEFGYTHSQLVDGKLTSTNLAFTILNGVNPEGEGAIRRSGDNLDYLVQGYHFFGSSNSIGAFYYHGNTKFNGEDPDLVFKDTFDRYGVVGSYWFANRISAVAGLVGGKDKSTELGQTINNRGWFLESDISASPKWSFTYRHDEVDPDTDFAGDLVKADTISTTYHPVDNILITLEYYSLRAEEKDYNFVAQFRLAY